MKIDKKWLPFIIALGLGLLAAIYYIASGRGSYDLGVRDLAKDQQIEHVTAGDAKKIQVKCKNGENYEITFNQDRGSYADLIFNACGPEGTQQ